jgi:hypothetical protein
MIQFSEAPDYRAQMSDSKLCGCLLVKVPGRLASYTMYACNAYQQALPAAAHGRHQEQLSNIDSIMYLLLNRLKPAAK